MATDAKFVSGRFPPDSRPGSRFRADVPVRRWTPRWLRRSRTSRARRRPSSTALPATPPAWPLELYRSAVGKKWVMALTGIGLLGFVFAHMVGNLKVYLGAEDLNHYGEFLRELLEPLLPRTVTLWLLRIGLIVAFALHIHAAYALTLMNRRARPGGLRRRARLRRRRLRQPHDALDGRHRRPLHPLPPRRPHVGHGQPRLRAGRPVQQPRRQLRPARRRRRSTSSPTSPSASTSSTGRGRCSRASGSTTRGSTTWRRRFAQAFAAVIVLGNVSFPIAVTVGVLEPEPVERIAVCEEREELRSSEPCQDAVIEAIEEARS